MGNETKSVQVTFTLKKNTFPLSN